MKERGLLPLGLRALSINTQLRSQAKGLSGSGSQHWTEELGSKRNVLVCVSDRQVGVTGHLSQACLEHLQFPKVLQLPGLNSTTSYPRSKPRPWRKSSWETTPLVLCEFKAILVYRARSRTARTLHREIERPYPKEGRGRGESAHEGVGGRATSKGSHTPSDPSFFVCRHDTCPDLFKMPLSAFPTLCASNQHEHLSEHSCTRGSLQH